MSFSSSRWGAGLAWYAAVRDQYGLVGFSGPLVLYLCGDAAEESPTGTLRWEGGQAVASGTLTAREMEVLR